MQHEQKPLKEMLEPILRVLNDLGGTFTFMDDDGNRFVLSSQDVFEGEQEQVEEQQLTLPQAESVSRAIRKHIDPSLQDDVLDRINRDIALAYALHQELEEEEIDGLNAMSDEFSDDDFNPTPARIRFEPLKGDLSPELQE